MKKQKINSDNKFDMALKVLRKVKNYDLLLEEVALRIINEKPSIHKENLDLWVPILYRLSLVQEAIIIATNALNVLDYEKEQELELFYRNIRADEILLSNSELIKLIIQECMITVHKTQFRKKSLFSIKKKNVSIENCLDLLGIEFYLDYNDFFSDKLNVLISSLGNHYKVLKYKDFLSVGLYYKYIPFIDIILQEENGVILQLKIKCAGFEGAEMGVNYFEYKEYNIDSIYLDDHKRLLKILYLNGIESSNSLKEVSRVLFDEIKTGKYIHENDSILKTINSNEYLTDIETHKVRMNGVIV